MCVQVTKKFCKKSMSDKTVFECEACREECPQDEFDVCEVCKTNPVCKTCLEGQDVLRLAEWLENINNKCSKCGKKGCQGCIEVCYSCANEGDYTSSFCTDCFPQELTKIPCKYHYWLQCDRHKEKKCPECRANRNYDLRHQM